MTVAAEDFAAAWEAWHTEHEAQRCDPLGILAATALHWLSAQPLRSPGTPGSWRIGRWGPEVDLPAGEQLVTGDRVISGRHAFGLMDQGETITCAFIDGEVPGAIEIADRSGRILMRPRRTDGDYLADFPGTPAYPPDARWQVPVRFTAQGDGARITLGSVVPDLEHEVHSPGVLDGEIDGQELTLRAISSRSSGELIVLFTDATNEGATAPRGRSLTVPAPDAEGCTVLDLNRAVNLPSAYTDFATCPVPPEENWLGIAVEAGEKRPARRVGESTG